MGLQFENLVLNNIAKLCDLIGIDVSYVEQAGPFFQKKTGSRAGCQIDLLIQAKFNTLYLCEIKFYTGEVGKEVIRDVETKIERLDYPKGYTVRPILLHVNGVTASLRDSGYFDKIIDFNKLLEH